MNVMGISSRDATSVLKATNWDLNLALDSMSGASVRIDPLTESKLEAIFEKYMEDQETIGIDGTLQYIEDLGYQPEDLVVLALAQFLNSPSTAVFKRDDFIKNWGTQGVSNLEEMQSQMQRFEKLLEEDDSFLQSLYNFTFKYILEEGQRNLSLETAIEYWNLLLSKFDQSHIDLWCKFIAEVHDSHISRDQWTMTYEFFKWWSCHDLKEYDEALAWPSLMDTFVEDQLGLF